MQDDNGSGAAAAGAAYVRARAGLTESDAADLVSLAHALCCDTVVGGDTGTSVTAPLALGGTTTAGGSTGSTGGVTSVLDPPAQVYLAAVRLAAADEESDTGSTTVSGGTSGSTGGAFHQAVSRLFRPVKVSRRPGAASTVVLNQDPEGHMSSVGTLGECKLQFLFT